MRIEIIIGVAIIVAGILLLGIRKFRNKIANAQWSSVLTYVSFLFSLAGFVVVIVAVPMIVNNIYQQTEQGQQIEEKIRQIEEKVSSVPILETPNITLKDTLEKDMKVMSKTEFVQQKNEKFKEYVEQKEKDSKDFAEQKKKDFENFKKQNKND